MELLQQLFAAWAGEPCNQCLALGANGSNRHYFRLVGATHRCIGAVADDKRENEAFFAYSRHLLAKGMRVPELYVVADDRRHYLQQDLGDQTLYGLLREKKQQGGGFDAQMLSLYKQALADLDALQRAGADMDFGRYGFPHAAFDRISMQWDLNYFKYFFLKLNDTPFDEQRLEDDFSHLIDSLLEANQRYFLYRDFNPRNIMVTLDSELYYIDYQGGRRGAAQYDVASLLFSAKSDLPEAIRLELLRHYVALHGDIRFMDRFWHYVLIRILQTLGAYGYRGLHQRKPYFVESIPLAVANLKHLAEEHSDILAGLPELHRIIDKLNATGISGTIGMGAALGTFPAGLTVTIQSFSYKQGLPEDPSGNGGGHIFDCRALPNPGRYQEYKCYTGKDRPVIDFLQKESAVDTFLAHARAIVAQSVDKYLERHFTHLNVAFGCTGGQHRSVYCAEQLASWLQNAYPQVNIVVHHREQE